MELSIRETLKKQSLEIINLFNNWDNNVPFSYEKSILDCSLIHEPQWLNSENTKSKKSGTPVDGQPIAEFFAPLTPLNHYPCVYFYEILNEDISGEEILSKYLEAKEKYKPLKRNFSATRKKPDLNSKILYVGKVQKDLGGRHIVHSGLYSVGATGGLQLALWAKELGLKLRLHVFAAENPKMAEYLVPLENRLAQVLSPIIGKHK